MSWHAIMNESGEKVNMDIEPGNTNVRPELIQTKALFDRDQTFTSCCSGFPKYGWMHNTFQI